jgi:hypothetical protein
MGPAEIGGGIGPQKSQRFAEGNISLPKATPYMSFMPLW